MLDHSKLSTAPRDDGLVEDLRKKKCRTGILGRIILPKLSDRTFNYTL